MVSGTTTDTAGKSSFVGRDARIRTLRARVSRAAARLARGLGVAVAAYAAAAAADRPADSEARARHVPDDPLFADQWHLDNTGQGGAVADADIDAPEAWAITRGSPDVVIAVLDDGVELDHPDLEANIAGPGRDFTTLPAGADAAPVTGDDRHGTAVAGVAAARGDNGQGVTGVCPRCSILPLRVDGSASRATAAAFRYAAEHGADVVTNSWGFARVGSDADDAAVREAIDTAARTGRGGLGLPIVFGMTNEPVDNCSGAALDVAALASVIAVGVSNHNDEIGGSGFGECMDLVAPSKPQAATTIGITTTDRRGLDGHASGAYHARFGGTSTAAPIVAGIAGLLLSLNPELESAAIRRILEHTAEKIDPGAARYDARGFSARAGHGRVNAARALTPYAKISVSPARVTAGEPFSVTVTASAPYGLETLSWSGIDADPAVPGGRVRRVDGRAYAAATWTDVVVERAGRYVVTADARDVRHARPVPGYPHSASAAGPPATATITVHAPRGSAVTAPLR